MILPLVNRENKFCRVATWYSDIVVTREKGYVWIDLSIFFLPKMYSSCNTNTKTMVLSFYHDLDLLVLVIVYL